MAGNKSGVDGDEFRKALGRFLTGVAVVTTFDETDDPRGLTANSFTSVSLDPPLVLVCVSEQAGSFDAFGATSAFAVNVLAADQREISNLFASRRPDKFEHIKWHTGPGGAPVLEDGLACYECLVRERMMAGDHMILVGEVVACRRREAQPLGFYASRYVSLGAAIDNEIGDRVDYLVGALIEIDDALVLTDGADGNALTIPTAPVAPHRSVDKAWRSLCNELGIEAELGFAYALFNLDDHSPVTVLRGSAASATGLDPERCRLVRLGDIPWPRIAPRQVGNMLRRFIAERDTGDFGIFLDDADGGRVGALTGHPTPWTSFHAGVCKDRT